MSYSYHEQVVWVTSFSPPFHSPSWGLLVASAASTANGSHHLDCNIMQHKGAHAVANARHTIKHFASYSLCYDILMSVNECLLVKPGAEVY